MRVNYHLLKQVACSPRCAFAARFAALTCALQAWLGSCEHPQQSAHTEPLSSPSERHLHNEDMRPVDRDPYYMLEATYLNTIHLLIRMRLRCHHCGHEWDYKGKSKYYATCPVCYYKVRIRESSKDNSRQAQTD